MTPLWEAMPKAIRRFNWMISLPRTWMSLLAIRLGLKRLKDPRPVLLTFSISEDHVQLWYRFASKAVGDRWQIVIGDSRGDIDPAKLPGARVIRVWNQLYHGEKLDLFIRKVLGDRPVFLCDDDRYPLFDPTNRLKELDDPKVGVLSFSPRTWYALKIGQTLTPAMGSHALLFRPQIFRRHDLKFQSPKGIESPYRAFSEGVKEQKSYDTADFANERLLQLGYRTLTESNPDIIGFDGLSGARILISEMGYDYVERALLEAKHFREGSTNGYVLKAVAAIAGFEEAYRGVFGMDPAYVSGFSLDGLVAIVKRNPHLTAEERAAVAAYASEVRETARRLQEHALHV